MPNKLRPLTKKQIAERWVMRMEFDDLQRFAYEEQLNWLESISIEEIQEIYELEPEILYRPTLSEMIDNIWDNLKAKYTPTKKGQLVNNCDGVVIWIDTREWSSKDADLHNQNIVLSLELKGIIRGR